MLLLSSSLGVQPGFIGGGVLSLGPLTLSSALQIGTAASGTILGARAGSTIVANIPGITINSAARTFSGTPTGSAQTISNGLVETLAGASNSPRSNAIAVLASAGGISAPVLTKTSATNANPIAFSIAVDSSVSVGMYWRLQIAGNSAFTTPLGSESAIRDETRQITSGDFTGGPVAFSSLTAMPDGVAYVRLRIESDSGSFSAWSNVLTDTLVSPATNGYDAAGSSSKYTFSNSNKRATRTGTGTGDALGLVRGISTVAATQTGERYFEVTFAGISTELALIGLTTGADVAGNHNTNATGRFAAAMSNVYFVNGNYMGGGGGGFGPGDTVGIIYSASTNGITVISPAGITYPYSYSPGTDVYPFALTNVGGATADINLTGPFTLSTGRTPWK